jgi:hypothetical protein
VFRRLFIKPQRGIPNATTAPRNQYGTSPPLGERKIPIADSILSFNPGVLKTGSICGKFFQVLNFQILKLKRERIPSNIDP